MSIVGTLFDLSDTAVIYCDTTVWVKNALHWGSECSAADLVVLILDRGWFCFSNHMNRIQGYDGSAIFSIYKASRNGDTRRLIRVTKTLHKTDVFKENHSLNQHFCWWHVALCISLLFQIWLQCILSSHEILFSFLYQRWSDTFEQPLVSYST